jgi:hypothetical protein
MAILTAAGILTAGLLQLGSASIASASTPPAGPTAKAVSEGVALSPAAVQNFGFYWNGIFAEYVSEVNFTGNTLTVGRYPGASSVIDRWMAGSAPALTLNIVFYDYIGNVVKSYTFRTPILTRVEISRDGQQQKLTIKYLP